MGSINLDQSFNDLGIGWNPNNQPITKTLQAIKELCGTPIGKLGNEDLRLATNHRLNLAILLEIIVERLREAPLSAGKQHAGDLLLAALSVPVDEWGGNQGKLSELKEIAAGAIAEMPDKKSAEYKEIEDAYRTFEAGLASR